MNENGFVLETFGLEKSFGDIHRPAWRGFESTGSLDLRLFGAERGWQDNIDEIVAGVIPANEGQRQYLWI